MPMPGFGSPYPQPSYPPSSNFPPYPSSSSSSFPSYPMTNTPYPPYPMPGGGNFGPPNASASGGTGTIKEEHIRESLLTAIEEKLMRRMKEKFQQTQAELETLKRTQEELKQGKIKLDTILMKLQKEQVQFLDCLRFFCLFIVILE